MDGKRSTLSRRRFVQAAAASAAVLAVSGCGTENKLVEPTKGSFRLDADVDPEVTGTWRPGVCASNCGGRCLNKAFVVDNVVVRQKTDDTHEDSPNFAQRRACLRGRSQRRHFFGPDRLKYPMKRKGWSAENPNGEMRGKDEWERITWDEAYEILTSQIKTITDKYGASAILTNEFGDTHITAALNGLNGSCSVTWSTGSEGTLRFRPNYYYGFMQFSDQKGSDRYSMMDVDHLVMYGANPLWASGGTVAYELEQIRKSGTKFYSVGPMYDASACFFDAEWFPVRAGTDNAFLAACAYVMLTEDDPSTNALIDWDFLNKYTLGFDSEHMPANAKINENFKDYVLGVYDGTPKTPEWATEICGTPVEKIKDFAHLLAKDNKTYIGFSHGTARRNGSESFGQMLMTLTAMGGHFGHSGHGCSPLYFCYAGNDGYPLVRADVKAYTYGSKNGGDDVINTASMWDAILDGRYIWNGAKAASKEFSEVFEEREIDIHMVWFISRAHLATQPDMLKGVRALRKVDFVVNQSWAFRPEAKYADLVLPVTTHWERPASVPYRTYADAQREYMLVTDQVVEPLYESKSDFQIAYELMEKMGADPKTVFPVSEAQFGFDQIAGISVVTADKSVYAPAVTITQADLDELGFEGEPQEGLMSYKEVLEAGIVHFERHQGDAYNYINLEEYYTDPEGKPRGSETGKMEIYSQRFADQMNNMGYDPNFSVKPYPTYITHEKSYDKLFVGGDIASGEREKYGYQVFNPHYLRTAHATMGNVDWLQEAFTDPIFINSENAEEKGIKSGDTVLVQNDQGKILRHALVTDLLMPFELALPHGGWLELHEDEGIDYGGCENVLTASYSTAGVSAYNSVFVDIEKYDGEALVADCLRDRLIVPCQE